MWLTPPPAQNTLAHIPGSTVFESAGSLNRDLHFPGSTLLKSVEPRMCSHTFRDEGGVAHPPPNPEYARSYSGFARTISGILQKVHSPIIRDPTKSSLTHNPGFYKKFTHANLGFLICRGPANAIATWNHVIVDSKAILLRRK